jgi:hypothetical protein
MRLAMVIRTQRGNVPDTILAVLGERNNVMGFQIEATVASSEARTIAVFATTVRPLQNTRTDRRIADVYGA